MNGYTNGELVGRSRDDREIKEGKGGVFVGLRC